VSKTVNKAHKGRRNEYKTIHVLEEEGYYCVRSAGSKGLFDIIAIRPNDIKMIQVKTNRKPTKQEVDKLWTFGGDYLIDNSGECTHIETWLWKDKQKKPEIEVIW